jgi:hypothetical protein
VVFVKRIIQLAVLQNDVAVFFYKTTSPSPDGSENPLVTGSA